MKKLIAIISIMFWGLVVFGQSTPAEVAPDGWLSNPDYQYVWGSTTLTDADTLSHVWRVKGNRTYDINIKLYTDWVKDSVSATVIGYQSIDGVNYEATGDTITVTDLVADAMDSEVIDLDNFLYPYLKVTMIQSAGDTAQCIPKLYLYAKEN
jgi:hypothetical protein